MSVVQNQKQHHPLSSSVRGHHGSSSNRNRHGYFLIHHCGSPLMLLMTMIITMILYYSIIVLTITAAASVVIDSKNNKNNHHHHHRDIGQQLQLQQAHHYFHYIAVANKHLSGKTTRTTLPSKSSPTTTSHFRPMRLSSPSTLPPNLHPQQPPPPVHQPIPFGTTATTTTTMKHYGPLAPTPPHPSHHKYVRGMKQQQDRALAKNKNDNDCLSLIGDIIRSGQQNEDLFGGDVSISQNGQFVAVGAGEYDGVAGNKTGLVRVYENTNVNNNNNNNNGQQWIQRGNNIEGETASDFLFANALSNDGNILAVGAPWNDDNVGYVWVSQFNEALGGWQQLGDTLVGLAASDYFGFRVALSGDGAILAVGAVGSNDEGQVRVFFWNGSSWVNRGDPFNGQNSGDFFGWAIALSEDGNILAVYAGPNDANGKINSGSVQVFEFTNNNNNWNPLGQELYGGNADDYFGVSVSLSSNGFMLAVGALADSNGVWSSGQVQVYHFNENDKQWTQHGSSLTGSLEGEQFGWSVSLSGNGLILAVGAPPSSWGKGFLRVFQWDNDGEDWQPFGNDLVGTTVDDKLGMAVAVARDGSTVVVGGDAPNTGHPGLAMVVQLDATCQLDGSTPSPTMSPTMSPTTKNPTTTSLTTKNPTSDTATIVPNFWWTFWILAAILWLLSQN